MELLRSKIEHFSNNIHRLDGLVGKAIKPLLGLALLAETASHQAYAFTQDPPEEEESHPILVICNDIQNPLVLLPHSPGHILVNGEVVSFPGSIAFITGDSEANTARLTRMVGSDQSVGERISELGPEYFAQVNEANQTRDPLLEFQPGYTEGEIRAPFSVKTFKDLVELCFDYPT